MPANVLTTAIRLLSRREHTAYELQQKLQQRQFSSNDITDALQRLLETDLQSDLRFCAAYIRQQQERFGDFRLRYELAKRGAEEGTIENAIAAAALPAETTRVIEVMQKKYPQGLAHSEQNSARRFLQSRGFSADSIRCAIRQAICRGAP